MPDPDVLRAAKEIARRDRKSLGRVLSKLAREALIGTPRLRVAEPSASFYGFEPFPSRGPAVDNETVDRLRDQEGV